MTIHHVPVLLAKSIERLKVCPGGSYVDCTLDGGGHAKAILEASEPDGTLIGLDMDSEMIERTRKKLGAVGRLSCVHSNFADLSSVLGDRKVDGILADLGFSSLQLEDSDRGLSFQHDGPLDMRLDPQSGETVSSLLESLDQEELANCLYRYGEEKFSRRIAKAIKLRLESGPIESTLELAGIIKTAIPPKFRSRKINPATKSFMALRIKANGELDNLERMLPQALEALKPGGRLAIISYHSLEDRIVRNCFRDWAKDCICPPGLPICTCNKVKQAKVITRKPDYPGAEEIAANPRARSAKLRVAERLVQ